MRDSIIVDMKYADLDIINGQYGVERHHCLGGPNRKKQMKMAYGFRSHQNITERGR